MQQITKGVNSIFIAAAKLSLKLRKRKRVNNVANKKWFDRDCKTKRNVLRRLSNEKHRNSRDNNIHRQQYHTVLKDFTLLLKQKKKYFHDRKLEQLEQDSNSSYFWKTLKSMNDNFEESSPPQISEEEWINYFSKLHSNKQLNDFQKKVAKSEPHVESTYTDDLTNNLNAQISNEEIKIAIKNLKTQKSAYSDRIKNEMIKVSLPELWKVLSYLFNLILKAGILPQLWCVSSCVGKRFCSVS